MWKDIELRIVILDVKKLKNNEDIVTKLKDLKDLFDSGVLTEDEFKKVCEKFTNKRIFKKNPDGTLFYDNTGSLIKNNYDNIV